MEISEIGGMEMLMHSIRYFGKPSYVAVVVGIGLAMLRIQDVKAEEISFHCSFAASETLDAFEENWVVSSDKILENGDADEDARNISITAQSVSWQSVGLLQLKEVQINRLDRSAREHVLIRTKGASREWSVSGTCTSH